MMYIFFAVPWLLIIVASIVDWRTMRLPHVLTLPAAAVAIFAQGYFGSGWMEAFAGAVGGWGIIKGTQILCRRRLRRECIGSGDAILMLSPGALLGLDWLPWGIGAAGAMGFIAAKFCDRKKMPFGPFLVAGCILVSFLKGDF
jgi:prepilin signal peptidase PulO-like enzyme (type II secretory pathway)